MMMKYPREAIVAAISGRGGSSEPPSVLLEEAGIHPHLATVAMEVGASATTTFLLALGSIKQEADAMEESESAGFFSGGAADMGTAAFSSAFLRGVLVGVALAEKEAEVQEAMPEGQHFTREALPPAEDFGVFEKQGHTLMARICGPFSCVTIDGNIARCDDGWLALDGAGFPYPVADHVARSSYIVQ